MFRRTISILLIVLLAVSLLTGCAKPAAQPEPAPKKYQDGVYEGYSWADDKGYAWAKVEIKDDKIVRVELKEFDALGLEKDFSVYPYAEAKKANEEMPAQFVAANSAQVDGVAKATSSSRKYRRAVAHALEKALVVPSNSNKYFDGVFMAISDRTEKGWAIAWVTIEEDKIIDLKLIGTTPKRGADGEVVKDSAGNVVFERKLSEDLIENGEVKTARYPYLPYHEARVKMAANILRAQSTNVDTITGATGTSNQWKQAVDRALEMAKK